MRCRSASALLLGLCAAVPARAQLTIRLTAVPVGTPPAATIHVAGSFNAWNPAAGGYALAPQPGGGYSITLPDSLRGALEFKFTLGSWETVETTEAGGDVANRAVTVPATGAASYAGTIAGWHGLTPSTGGAKRSTATASVSILRDSFPLAQLGRTRRIWLYLPPGYATSSARYPVLYLQDGQNVFDERTGFSGEWGVDETLDSLHARGDPGVIVVAVDNGGDHRLDEYNPWPNANRAYGGGEGDAYVDFLVHSLKPWVDQHYRTRPDRVNTGILGSSAGGLISLYAALEHPEVFGHAGVFSCACWLADPQIYALARRATPGRAAPRFYFVSGEFETREGQPALDQRRMVDTLVAAGFARGLALQSLTIAGGKHAEWFWRREFPAAYRWMFER